MSKIETRKSTISGYGAFAKEKIAKGELIMTLVGESFITDDIDKACKERGIGECDPLQIDDVTYLDLTPTSKYINHSCEPNAGIRKNSDLIAIKEIERGEEITYDYATTVGVNDTMLMHCHCGAKNCRKLINNILSISKATLDKYSKLNVLPDFIKRQLGLL